jgi:hypothetical protein
MGIQILFGFNPPFVSRNMHARKNHNWIIITWRENIVNGKSDTPPRIHEIMIAGYRRMTPAEKLKRVSELTITTQQLALARILKQYGPCSQREQQLRLAALRLDRETMIRVFGWDPVEKGY